MREIRDPRIFGSRSVEENRRLFAARQSDVERWRDATGNWGDRFPVRARFAGRLIAPGASVVDIGSGTGVLARFLRPGCRYTPCDLVDRGEGTIVADLNKGELPNGRWDVAACLGVLEFLHGLPQILSALRAIAPVLVASYCPALQALRPETVGDLRASFGFRNSYTAQQFLILLEKLGWTTIASRALPGNQMMVYCVGREA